MNNKADHDLLERGVAEAIGRERLEERLKNGDILRIKLGVDPTSPHLHLGRSIPLLKLRDFQERGHQIVFIVGDFTGVIGDTSDKESERPMLTKDEIEKNKESYFEQVGKLVDLRKAEFRHNSEWLSTLTYQEIGEHADQFSVADFIARDNIKRRLDAGKRVSLREVLYPLMQGYDSVAVDADVEIGGTDQRFNLLAGRTLEEHSGREPQAILMNPLILGLDGRKMSSSWGNTINLDDDAADMYGKVMSLRDELVVDYLVLTTRYPMEEITDLTAKLAVGDLHPKDAKMLLAREIVTLYHGADAAAKAEAAFVQTFQEGKLPDDIPTVAAQKGDKVVDVLLAAGIITSKSEWRRLIDGGGVHHTDGEGTTMTDVELVATETITLKLGKRRFVTITT
jgi:tyrosyl-tRNA synthetase